MQLISLNVKLSSPMKARYAAEQIQAFYARKKISKNRARRKTIYFYPRMIYTKVSYLYSYTRGVNVWGGGGGGVPPPPPPPQRNDPVGLKLSAVGLKIMRLFIHVVLCEAK
jgi:hypothetical protein